MLRAWMQMSALFPIPREAQSEATLQILHSEHMAAMKTNVNQI